MLVYHGSDVVVKKPIASYSVSRLDFGKGFYVTTVKFQAERWSRRKALINRKTKSFVNVYECLIGSDFNIKDFGNDTDEWIDFVCACRAGEDVYKNFDIIKGLVANDKVFRVVDMYRRGLWDKERAIQEMKAYSLYDQIAFISQAALDSSLVFQYSYEVIL